MVISISNIFFRANDFFLELHKNSRNQLFEVKQTVLESYYALVFGNIWFGLTLTFVISKLQNHI